MLDYIVTSNHIHLLAKDTGINVIAQSMQLTGIRKPVPIVPVVSPPGSSPGSVQNVSDKRSFKAPRSIFKMRGQRVGELSGFRDPKYFQTAHREWAEQALENGLAGPLLRSGECAVGIVSSRKVKGDACWTPSCWPYQGKGTVAAAPIFDYIVTDHAVWIKKL